MDRSIARRSDESAIGKVLDRVLRAAARPPTRLGHTVRNPLDPGSWGSKGRHVTWVGAIDDGTLVLGPVGSASETFFGNLTPFERWTIPVPSGEEVAATSPTARPQILDLVKGDLRAAWMRPDRPLGRLLLRYGGTSHVSIDRFGTIRVWSADTGSLESEFHTALGTSRLTISRDGRRIASAQNGKVYVWSVPSRRLLRIFSIDSNTVTDRPVSDLGLGQTGSRLVASAGRKAHVWDVDSTRLLGAFESDFDLASTLITPDGRFVYGTTSAGTAFVWGPDTKRLVFTVERINPTANAPLAMTPDARLLAGCCLDGTARFYDVPSGELLATYHFLGDRDFLWTTPPDEASPDGWFWTERPADAIDVLERVPSGSPPTRPAYATNPAHPALCERYLAAHNQPALVLGRLAPGMKPYRAALARRLALAREQHELRAAGTQARQLPPA